MESLDVWKHTFEQWPNGVDRSGIVVTTWQEQVAFKSFLTSETMLLLERQTPDAAGARLLLMPYHAVACVKITAVVKPKAFVPLGFTRATMGDRGNE